jgi:hypothetical protein
VGGDRDRDLGAGQRLLEGQRDGGLEVLAALRRGLGAGAAVGGRVEDVAEDVAPAAGRGAATAAGAAPEGIAAGEDGAAAVVLLALLGVAEDVVGLRDLLKALFGAGVGVRVRVVLARELAVRLLDVLLGGLLVDPEGPVVVRTAGHGYAATTTRAGRRTAPLIR